MNRLSVLVAALCGTIMSTIPLTAIAQTPPAAKAPAGVVEADPPGEAGHLDFAHHPPVRFEAMNPANGPGGDLLSQPRLIAAAVVAQDKPNPHFIADLGSFTGEFLEAFMQRFPNAHGQWTEPVDKNEDNAKIRLARFGDHVSYVIGCPSRDVSLDCIPKEADVIITSWVSIHQPLDGMAKVYAGIYTQLPSGGWFVNLDHVSAPNPEWAHLLGESRKEFHVKQEGPPLHIKTPFPTLDEQLAAFKVAGFNDVQVVWSSMNDVLFMARKP